MAASDEVYLASADWMTRNLDQRIEVMFPVTNPRHHTRVVALLRAMFQDNTKARQLGADGVYRRKTPATGEAPYRVRSALQDEARREAAAALDRANVTFRPAVKG